MTRTRQDLERALDGGFLFGEMSNGRFWPLRRNGKTRTWKRDPVRFEIPVKAGINRCATLTNDNMQSGSWRIEVPGL